ncbi:MAG: AMP-binding enzyme [Acidimicrobiales bacterium]
MRDLVALDLALGPDFQRAVAEVAASGDAFCVLDRRLSPRARAVELERLAPTHVLDATGRRARPEGRGVDDGVGLVMLTSGTSGSPKAAELTWTALAQSAAITQATLRDDEAPAWYPCLPACHIGGLAVVLRGVLSDAALVWGDPDRPDAGPTLGATHVAVVRAQLARFDLAGYRTVLLGGARPPRALAENVVTTWGMTETGSGVVYDGVALPGVELAIVGEELCVRSPTLFARYRDRPRPRAVGPDGRDDWFPTGDAGRLDGGRLTVFGRLGYVINTGGEKVWPEDLEAVLARVEGVSDVAVTGRADDEWGERVVALVVAERRDLDGTLRAAAEEAIGPWAKPKEIRYVTAIPRTTSGKVRRSDLAHVF